MESVLTVKIIKIKAKAKKVEKWLLKIKKFGEEIWRTCAKGVEKNPIAERARGKEGRGIFNLFISVLLIFRIIYFYKYEIKGKWSTQISYWHLVGRLW